MTTLNGLEATLWFLVGASFVGFPPIIVGLRNARRAARQPPRAPIDPAELREVADALSRLSRTLRAAAAGEEAARDDRAGASV